MLADFSIVGEVVFHLPYKAFLILGVDICRAGPVITRKVEQRGVAVVAPEAHVHAEGGMQLEVVPDLEFASEGAHDLVAPVLVCGKAHGSDGVHHFVVAAAGDHEYAALCVF